MRTSTRYFAVLAFCTVSIIALYILNDNIESERERGKSRRRPELKFPEDYNGEEPYQQKRLGQESDSKEDKRTNHHKVSNVNSGQDCSPKHNIIFTKVHKSGSSTLQNIFLRYGDRHDLTFVLPPYGHHLGYPKYFDKQQHMLHTADDEYNIFCHHARFSPDIVDVMPKDSIYISILRNPVDVFESAFTYFKIDFRMGKADDPNALTEFLANPKKYSRSMKSTVHTRNNMLFDFGVSTDTYDDEQQMKSAIKTITDTFSLILIGDYFDESLILLRDLLCWRTEDIVVFRMNSRDENSVQRLSAQDRQRILEWNKGDVLLYERFNKTLWQKIEQYGRDKMAVEVKKLQKLTDKYKSDCVLSDQAGRADADFAVWQPKGVKINGFTLKEEAKGNVVCERMIKPEIQYTEELRRKQFGQKKNPRKGMVQQRNMRRRRFPPN